MKLLCSFLITLKSLFSRKLRLKAKNDLESELSTDTVNLGIDLIWKSVIGAETFKSFQEKIIHPIHLNKNLKQDIKDEIAIVEKLLLHSYFEYEFMDMAFIQAAFALEKALKWKYQEVNNVSSGDIKMGFGGLIDWFASRNYFETWNVDNIHQLRDIRNDKAHNERKSLGGSAFLGKIYNIIDLINDIEEDVKLRVKRKKSIRLWNTQLHKFLEGGGIILLNGQRIIIYRMDLLFLNNKTSPSLFDFIAWPIFDCDKRNKNGYIVPTSNLLHLTSCHLTKDLFKGKDINTGRLITILKVEDEQNKLKFEQWYKDVRAQNDLGMIGASMRIRQNDYYNAAVRKFHQT